MAAWKTDKLLKAASEGRKGFYMISLMYFNAAKNTAYEIPRYEEQFNKARAYFDRKLSELEAFFASCPDHVSREELDAIDDFLRDWPEEGCGYDIEGAMSDILHGPLAQLLSKYAIFFMNIVASVESYMNLRVAALCAASSEIDSGFLEIFNKASTAAKPRKVLEKMYPGTCDPKFDEALSQFERAVRVRNSFVHHLPRPPIFSTRNFNLNDIIGEKDISFDLCVKCVEAAETIITTIGADSIFCEEMAFKSNFLGFEAMCAPSPYFQQIPSEWK
jgi:hypothetical protein